MAFKIVKSPTSWWPVQFSTVDAEGGIVLNEIDLRFAAIPIERYLELFEIAENRSPAEGVAHNRFVFDSVVRGWRGLLDADDNPAPFDDGHIAALLDISPCPQALGLAYIGYFNAAPATRLGNSKPSPDGGQATAMPTTADPAVMPTR